jgi:hypothetical protein
MLNNCVFGTYRAAATKVSSLSITSANRATIRICMPQWRFENEQLLELINRTAHAAALSALVETANGYRFYFGVYVRSVSRFTPVYMALIEHSASWWSIRHSFATSARSGIKPSAQPDNGTLGIDAALKYRQVLMGPNIRSYSAWFAVCAMRECHC